jgi:hypothetical protein
VSDGTYVGMIPAKNHLSVAWYPGDRVAEFEDTDTGLQNFLLQLLDHRPRLIVILLNGINVHPIAERLRSAGFLVQTAGRDQVSQIVHLKDGEKMNAHHLALAAARVRLPGEFDSKNPRPSFAQVWPPFPQYDEPAASDLVWRYMDVKKFVSLVEKKSLFFSAARFFEDPFEGSYPLRNSASELAKVTGENMDWVVRGREALRAKHFISCWHLSEFESPALWQRYGPNSIAIRSTFIALKESINWDSNYGSLFFTKVRYIDYETEGIQGQLAALDISPFFYKRKSFEFEKELRIVADTRHTAAYADTSNTNPTGFYVRVDLNRLLKRVYTTPGAQRPFEEMVRLVLRENGLMDIEVRPSDLDKDPVY